VAQGRSVGRAPVSAMRIPARLRVAVARHGLRRLRLVAGLVMSLATRVIARLDIKQTLGVVKGVRMEGLRVIGDPRTLATRYAFDADELLYLDVTASLYGRNALLDLVRWTAGGEVWIPLTVGGGLRSVDDVRAVLRAGADKAALNTAALARPTLITDCAQAFGSQAIVASLEIKRTRVGWEPYALGGREVTGRDALAWAVECVERGAGELLVTSIDRDGTRAGFDVEFLAALAPLVTVPIVASGGCGVAADAVRAIRAGADAVAVATYLHSGGSMAAIKAALAAHHIEVRA
jgi:imidazole glycerol-phosphate synthase subunit HisF